MQPHTHKHTKHAFRPLHSMLHTRIRNKIFAYDTRNIYYIYAGTGATAEPAPAGAVPTKWTAAGTKYGLRPEPQQTGR